MAKKLVIKHGDGQLVREEANSLTAQRGAVVIQSGRYQKPWAWAWLREEW